MVKKLDFPATTRNAAAITAVLHEHLPAGNVLEIAAGSGQHSVYFAEHLPLNTFWPSDPEPAHVQSINAWGQHAALSNLYPPVQLDTTHEDWQSDASLPGLPERLDAILCINMIHIAPIAAAIGLFAGAANRLSAGKLLYLYGPFLGTGEPDAPSNLAFDADLKRRNRTWGVRQLSDAKAMATQAGFNFDQTVPMPANNVSVLFRKV
ncbi:MAG: DUF938 domain-containing protein [Robiginitomaculum sp.]|nr:DUF938 domain-containing protein [Robiginitomaculum sp.]